MGWICSGAGIFLFGTTSRPDQVPSRILYNGYQGYFPGVKQLECEADSSPPSSAEVKNEWGFASTPPYLYGMELENKVIVREPFYMKILRCKYTTTFF
jgi:hypothetical protein